MVRVHTNHCFHFDCFQTCNLLKAKRQSYQLKALCSPFQLLHQAQSTPELIKSYLKGSKTTQPKKKFTKGTRIQTNPVYLIGKLVRINLLPCVLQHG